MKTTLAVLMLAGTFLCSVNVRAAAPETLTGGPNDLSKAVDARAAKLGKVTPAAMPFAQLVKAAPRKGALIQVAFNYITPIQHGAGETTFLGRHLAAGAFDFAVVTFPADIEISAQSTAIVIGSFAGTRTKKEADGSTTTVPVIAARVLGVIDGVTFPNGVPSYAPNSPIRVYEARAKKAAAKKETAPKPQP